MKTIISVASLLLSAISAGLWFWSAKMKPVYPTGYLSGPPREIVDALNFQAKLNAWAAFTTGLSVAFQAVTVCFQ